jgi:hypothetical protein
MTWIEHAVFMGWKTNICTLLEIAIFWDVMLCIMVDRCRFAASVFNAVQEVCTVWLQNPNGRDHFEEVGIDGRKILKLILTL